MAVRVQLSSASRLTQRLLWNAPPGKAGHPLPIVILLGPAGADKSGTLESISRDCGATVVHSLPLDFRDLGDRQDAPGTTATALAGIAGSMSRNWAGRPKARFYRFALGWIAVCTETTSGSAELVKDDLRNAINELTQRSARKASSAAITLVNAAEAARLLPQPVARTLRTTLPPLIRALGRHPLREAKQWFADFPDAEGGSPLDALYQLHQQRRKTEVVTGWLMNAFLADATSNLSRMARHDPKSTCGCELEGRHSHNWVLLLDNVDERAGSRFVSDLVRAREGARKLGIRPDPLLVIAASGRWDSSWEKHWCPPWTGECAAGQAPMTTTQLASYEHWARTPAREPRSDVYPVLLEPLGLREVADMLGLDEYSPECEFALKATAGLPAAVREIGPLLPASVKPGQRDALATPPGRDGNPWLLRLRALRLTDDSPGPETASAAGKLVAAAPFITAPWLVDTRAGTTSSEADARDIAAQLRSALWVSVAAGLPASIAQPQLHPWLAATLNRALASSADLYLERFDALLSDQGAGEPVRQAYCRLARGEFAPAVDCLARSFDTISHKEWMSQLRLITSAPDNRDLADSSSHLCEVLMEDYQLDLEQEEKEMERKESEARAQAEEDRLAALAQPGPRGHERQDAAEKERRRLMQERMVLRRKPFVARLVAAQWMESNPLAVPDRHLQELIRGNLSSLSDLSILMSDNDLHL